MTLSPNDAEKALLARYGEPAKEPTDYIIGFRTPFGRVLAIHRTSQEARICSNLSHRCYWTESGDPRRPDQ